MMFKELQGGALLIVAAQCCYEHCYKKLVFLRAYFVHDYDHTYQIIKTRLHLKLYLGHLSTRHRSSRRGDEER
jgi:hypothetical protein